MLNKKLKQELIEELYNIRSMSFFGDGQEKEYLMNGCNIVGLNDMSDSELLEEYEDCVDEDDELLVRCKLEMTVHSLLTQSLTSNEDLNRNKGE